MHLRFEIAIFICLLFYVTFMQENPYSPIGILLHIKNENMEVDMRYIVSGKEMQELDGFTTRKIGMPALVLMERAAMILVDVIKGFTDTKGRILMSVEGGNNGGDALAAARMLIAAGYQVDIQYIGVLKKVSEAFAVQKKILDSLGILTRKIIPKRDYAVIVDGIFGVGLSKEIQGEHKETIIMLNRMSGIKVAIDMPSGIDAASGKMLGVAFQADYTVTFGFEKVGMFFFNGIAHCGKVIVGDIGFPEKAICHVKPNVYAYDKTDMNKLPKRSVDSHKGTYGKVAVIAGSRNMSGAAYLAAKAAYLVGAGLVKVYTHESNRVILQTQLPEAILMTYEDYEESAITCIQDAYLWADVVAMGPGLGINSISQSIVQELLTHSKVPMVLDADALHILAKNIHILKKAKGDIVLTPHMKEMTRLVNQDVSDLVEHRFEEAKKIAEQYGVTCVLKDARTIVSDGNEQTYINLIGNNGMSTAGAGDVLTGIIAGMLAGGLVSEEAARMGTYVHSLAGDVAANKKGKYAMLASDIIDGLAEVLKGEEHETIL